MMHIDPTSALDRSVQESQRSAKHSSAKDKHMTPRPFADASRAVMGSIDCDPATTEFANRVIGAGQIYTAETDGMTKPWHGNVFNNPPGGALRIAERGTKSRAVSWWLKLVEEYQAGRTKQAIFLAFSLEFLQSVQKIKGGCKDAQWPLRYCACFPKDRIPFDLEAEQLMAEIRLKLAMEGELLTQKETDKLLARLRECESSVANGDGRVAGDQPTHGNVIIYLPKLDAEANQWKDRRDLFEAEFSKFGRIHNPYR